MKTKNAVPLRHGARVYAVAPAFALVREIEAELGGVAALAAQLSGTEWRVGDLVVLIQMMLQSAGETVDYMVLGEQMMKEGVAPYRAAALALLGKVLHEQ